MTKNLLNQKKKGVGRPRKDPSKRRSVAIRFFITPEEHDAIRRKYPDLNLNAYARNRFFQRRNHFVSEIRELNLIASSLKFLDQEAKDALESLSFAESKRIMGQISRQIEQLCSVIIKL